MKRWSVLFGFGLIASLGQGHAQETADLIILHGNVYTADRQGTFQEAVAIRGNRILQVGASQKIDALRGAQTKVIDAKGSAVLPGFNDTHVHFLQGGLALENVELQGARTLDEVQARIRKFAQSHPNELWIRGGGWGYGAFPGNLPTREQLDAAVPDRPAVMQCFDGHSVWVNSRALTLAAPCPARRLRAGSAIRGHQCHGSRG